MLRYALFSVVLALLLRYEDLWEDTEGVLSRVLPKLGLDFAPEDLGRAVEEHSWENVPDEEKGEGTFYRNASLGSWREDLTPDQARVVEDITAPLLE